MLDNQQHDKLKKLVKIAIEKTSFGHRHNYSYEDRVHALEEMAKIIDPECHNHGLVFKKKNTNRCSDAELKDAMLPNSYRQFPPRRA